MLTTKVIWVGCKSSPDMDGQFIDAHTRREIAVGGYGPTGYDVLRADGEVLTFRNAMQALSHLNKEVCNDTP